MKNKNICKFISFSPQEILSVTCFVLETDQEQMKKVHLLKEHRVILVTQGEGCFKFGEMRVPFGSGSLVFGFENELFSVSCDNHCEYLYINFSGTRPSELFRRFNINLKNRSFNGFDGLIPLWRDSLSRASEQTTDLASEGILLYTFSRLFANVSEYNNLVNKIVEISEEHFSDPELSIAAIAQMLSYNPKYISHIFKKKMGMGYSEYLRTLRIKYAVMLLEHGIDSVKNVAILSGFKDPFYFSTVFKKSIGISPKEYTDNLSKNRIGDSERKE